MGKNVASTDNPLADKLEELKLQLGADGRVPIKLRVGLTIDDFSGVKDEVCRCDPVVAVRLVERGHADPATEEESEASAVEPS
jgi:hypothetical protein